MRKFTFTRVLLEPRTVTGSEHLEYKDTRGGGGVLPYKALMGTCGQPGYVFRDFCLEQGIKFIIFVLIRVTIYQFLS